MATRLFDVTRITPGPIAPGTHRILCPVDFASGSTLVAWAAALARIHDGEVRLFHVIDRDSRPAPPAFDIRPPDAEERILSELFALARRLPGRPRVSAAVTAGSPTDEVVRHARLVRATAIAIDPRSDDALVRRLVIEACCPLLVVPDCGDPRPRDDRPIRTIVCGVDFLPASLDAATCAVTLGRRTGGPVLLLHVVRDPWREVDAPDEHWAEGFSVVTDHFRRLLQIAVSDAWSRGHASEIVVSGSPADEIVRLAESRSADLIVMGMDGVCGPTRVFGTTTKSVIDAAPCPVLLVPPRTFPRPRRDEADGPTAA